MAESFRKRTGWIFLVVMVGQVLLVSAQVQSRAGVPVIEAVSFGAFSRVQRATSSVVGGVRDVWTNYASLRGARDENQALKQQLAELEIRLQEQRALAARATRLQALLELKESTPLPTVAAEVIGGNPNATPGVREITIDRGTADGVQTSMAVISPGGVVGRVIGRPAAHAARVQLLIDRHAAAGAITERTRAGGIVVGAGGQPPLKMDLVSNLLDVKAGDLVVTSGVDGIYPKGYAIGWVETAERGRGLYLDIRVRPAVDFGSLEEVLVVLVPPRPALTDDEKAAGRSR
ncbi:MAG TPA: rod shape-determining protein MreC [Vicinamibacterales bacterium]|nr:rod shape-determining protein MreC [Vicinamibacterales bacterium]